MAFQVREKGFEGIAFGLYTLPENALEALES
jgi:hypothetical protein